jgi:hypothetical protein
MEILKFNGQATVEYIFILAFAIFLGSNFILSYSEFFSNSIGNISHVLSTNLIVGVCPSECWFAGYENSYKGSP